MRFLSRRVNTPASHWLALVVLLPLAGCLRQPVKPSPEPPPAPAPIPAPAAPVPMPRMDLAQIIAVLEDGDYATARTQLKLATAAEPGNAAARQLLAQLSTDPTRYLGAAFVSHVVESGESLAGLARQHLGHALEFVILARYNGIARPKLLQAGQPLKIPVGYRSPLLAAAKAKGANAGDGATEASGVAVLERDWPPPEGLDNETLGERFRERIEALLKAQRFDDAVATVRDARQRQPAGNAWAPWLNPLGTRANALLWQDRGTTQMAVATLESRQAAYDAFGQALTLIPALEPARERRQTLRQALLLEYHEAAIIQYRNQQLDAALALWDQALAIDPQFAPAQGYRTRALELKRRLRNLDVEPAAPEAPTPPSGR